MSRLHLSVDGEMRIGRVGVADEAGIWESYASLAWAWPPLFFLMELFRKNGSLDADLSGVDPFSTDLINLIF